MSILAMQSGAVAVSRPQERGFALWLTGFSGAGKSTLIEAVAARMRAQERRVEVLDGDAVRLHLSRGLGFSREDRNANVARIGFIAHLLARNGVVVLVAAISPFREARQAVRALVGDFVEVHVATPLEECIRRDTKGLYAKALSGALPQFTGVSDPYEEPLDPELRLDTRYVSVEEGVARIFQVLNELGYWRDGSLTP